MTVIPLVIGALETITKGLVKGLKELEIGGRGHPDYSIVKIGHNTEKSPKDLRKLAVTKTSVIGHQLTFAWKTCKR